LGLGVKDGAEETRNLTGRSDSAANRSGFASLATSRPHGKTAPLQLINAHPK
jgi:hypothetical protein